MPTHVAPGPRESAPPQPAHACVSRESHTCQAALGTWLQSHIGLSGRRLGWGGLVPPLLLLERQSSQMPLGAGEPSPSESCLVAPLHVLYLYWKCVP